MTNGTKPVNHWLALASQLGAVVPQPETPPPETTTVAAPEIAPEAATVTPQPLMQEAVPTPAAAPRKGALPKRLPAKPERPAKTAAPAKAKTTHWRSLAGMLGIELPPEPEPVEPVAVEEEPPVEVAAPLVEEIEPAPPRAPSELWRPPVAPVEEEVVGREPTAAERWPGETFPTEGFLERPGVLDDIFEEESVEPPARRLPLVDADSESPAEEPEADTRAPWDEGPDRPGRRRRRRRSRRPRREGEDETARAPAGREDEGGELDFEEDENEPPDLAEKEDLEAEEEPLARESEPSAEEDILRPKRRRRRRRRGGREGDREQEGAKPVVESAAGEAEAERGHDDEDDFEDEDDDGVAAQLKHHKLPTWEEAVACVIAVNQEARVKNPGGGHRGRGYRGRK